MALWLGVGRIACARVPGPPGSGAQNPDPVAGHWVSGTSTTMPTKLGSVGGGAEPRASSIAHRALPAAVAGARTFEPRRPWMSIASMMGFRAAVVTTAPLRSPSETCSASMARTWKLPVTYSELVGAESALRAVPRPRTNGVPTAPTRSRMAARLRDGDALRSRPRTLSRFC